MMQHWKDGKVSKESLLEIATELDKNRFLPKKTLQPKEWALIAEHNQKFSHRSLPSCKQLNTSVLVILSVEVLMSTPQEDNSQNLIQSLSSACASPKREIVSSGSVDPAVSLRSFVRTTHHRRILTHKAAAVVLG